MSINFSDWSTESIDTLKCGEIRLVILDDKNEDAEEIAKGNLVSAVIDHYVSPEYYADTVEDLGSSGIADLLRKIMPGDKIGRSGHIGEIIATEYIDECTEFHAPVKRLRWKDGRKAAMEGDDVIGISQTNDSIIHFLKAEVKSRNNLGSTVVNEAREQLSDENGLPAPFSLLFVSLRLKELGNSELSSKIRRFALRESISSSDVTQMIFTFSGNDPKTFLMKDLSSYKGNMQQISVGLKIGDHPNFIANIYERVVTENECRRN